MGREAFVIAVGSGWGANHHETEFGPDILFSNLKKSYNANGVRAYWPCLGEQTEKLRIHMVESVCSWLRATVCHALDDGYFPIVLGGDHSIAMGTWAGLYDHLQKKDFGLLWFDAHRDMHTQESSDSKNIHGMPLANLLGQCESGMFKDLTIPILNPKNVCQIGIRSFEESENNLSKKLEIPTLYQDDIDSKENFESYIEARINHMRKSAGFYGVSFDIDALDPSQAPGTGCYEPGGLKAEWVHDELVKARGDDACKVIEIAEFDPTRDKDDKTLNYLTNVMAEIL